MKCLAPSSLLRLAVRLIPALAILAVPCASAETIDLTPVQDNTLFQFDPTDLNQTMNSNGIGNFFAAGATFSRGQIQRGLMQFDFSDVPAGSVVVPGSVSLQLYVIDAPRREDPLQDRPYWLVAVPELDQAWGEGNSKANYGGGGGGGGGGGSGAGSGAVAQAGDATWFHTHYDPAVHTAPLTFSPGDPGFWPAEGLLGADALDPWALYGTPAGWAGDAGTYTSLAAPGMAADIQTWLDNPTSNFGWLLLGDETVDDENLSSKRGFGSREHTNADLQPVLTFQYAPIPEPGSALLAASALAGLALLRRRGSFRRP